MPKGTNQKLKLYYLSKIMLEKTDDQHGLTMPEIQKYLEEYEVKLSLLRRGFVWMSGKYF